EIELPAIVVAIAEQADAELVVLEEEAAEIELEFLDADAQRGEIEAVRAVQYILVDEELLHAERIIEAIVRLARAHAEHAPLGHVHIIGLESERDPIFDVRRQIGGRAFDQRGAEDEGLRGDDRAVAAEDVV